MIGIDRRTGRRIENFEQFVSRATQVLTTPPGGRAKRGRFGCSARKYLGANTVDSVLVSIQAASIAAFYVPENGLQDFKPSRCVAMRHNSGIKLYFAGKWLGRSVKFEVLLNELVSSPESST
jgi:hypothetical protein